MEDTSATVTPENFIDIAALRILDLRTLAQDEIRCLAHLCGDVPARLQDLVNVIVDKSIFNESAGSRRQTYDRERLPRNKERRLSSGSASAQLHLAIESAGRSHKDLILHFCRQLKISERGDRAMYQLQAVQQPGVVAEGSRSMSLKRMARASASLAGRADGAMAPLSKAAAEVLVNGKELGMEVLHRSSKKMKTKEEARRRAAESQAGAPESQEEKQALLAVKITSLGHDEPALLKDIPAGGMSSSSQMWNDLRSPDTGRAGAIGHSLEVSEPSHFVHGALVGRPAKMMKLFCTTCEKTFANEYSLRRHTTSTRHVLDTQTLETGVVHKKRKKVYNKSTLRCSCGNTYATPYTLRRHALATGHTPLHLISTSQATTPAGDHRQKVVKGEEIDGNADVKPGNQKLGILLPERALKSHSRRFTCRQCHRQFIQKKVFIRHMSTHFQRKKNKRAKTGYKLLGGRLSGSSGEVKVRRGRSHKRNRDVDIKHENVTQKRKCERASLDRRVRSRKASKKAQNFTCQECGKIYDEFSRYAGHLSMHARLRRVLVGEAPTPARDIVRKNMLNVKEVSALGFHKLLSDKTGTYLSGLPAKLLFSESYLANKQKGKV